MRQQSNHLSDSVYLHLPEVHELAVWLLKALRVVQHGRIIALFTIKNELESRSGCNLSHSFGTIADLAKFYFGLGYLLSTPYRLFNSRLLIKLINQ